MWLRRKQYTAHELTCKDVIIGCRDDSYRTLHRDKIHYSNVPTYCSSALTLSCCESVSLAESHDLPDHCVRGLSSRTDVHIEIICSLLTSAS